MIVDVCKLFREYAGFNKLLGDDYLFIEYKCPIDVEEYHLWAEAHFISYVISGKKDWMTAKKTYAIKGGDALFIKKGVYTTRQYFEDDYCVLLFFINDDFIKKFLSENQALRLPGKSTDDPDQIVKIEVDDSFQSLIQSIFHYFKQGTNIPQNLVELKFRELLFNIVLNPRNKAIAQFFYEIQQSPKSDIENIMLKNFQHDLSLEAFARLCGRSLSTFKRDFKNHFQKTPGKWLQEKRLERAKTLLLASNLNVQEIGYESGFKNASHFNKSFKEKFQLSPNRYRQQYSRV